MTDDESKRYKEVLWQAGETSDKWFVSNPDYFYKWAGLIAERHAARNKEYERLNPQKNKFDSKGRFNPHWKEIKPSIIDPIFVCVGEVEQKWNPAKHCNETRHKTLMPSGKEDVSMVYHTAVLIIHDGAAINGAGYEVITKNIWPKEQSPIWWASQFFDPLIIAGDRSAFIEAAIRHVEAAMPTISTEIKATELADGKKVGKMNEITHYGIAGMKLVYTVRQPNGTLRGLADRPLTETPPLSGYYTNNDTPELVVGDMVTVKDSVSGNPVAAGKWTPEDAANQQTKLPPPDSSEQQKGDSDEAYIPFTKAIELSNGILTRKKLDKAIDQSKPIKVRSKKPRANRLNVHIQDVLSLINKLSENDKAGEEAARMFSEYKKQLQGKTGKQINLD